MIRRHYERIISEQMRLDNRVIVIYGPRQVGKTTLVQLLLEKYPGKVLTINADDTDYQPVLSSRSMYQLRQLVSGYDLLFLDEAQRVPDIGINLKLLYDHLPGLKIIATGSSSFELANKVQEPLTGRSWTFQLMPIGLCELAETMNPFEMGRKLDDWLVFGAYPALFAIENRQLKVNYLQEIVRHDKIFFYDLGIRNAVIENFSPVANRNDGGKLWENFLIVERMKTQTYRREGANRYFWRTYTGAEIDYVEESGGQLLGFEFKFNQKNARAPHSWLENYPEATFQTVNRDNYLNFVLAAPA